MEISETHNRAYLKACLPCSSQPFKGHLQDLARDINVLDDLLRVVVDVLDVFSWIYQSIIVVQGHLYRDIILEDMSA